MGVKERRERERTELRQGILLAARAIAVEEGWQAVTIRKVAEQIEYSPPTIYEYFENKDAILFELEREGFRQLLAALQAAQASTSVSDVRLLNMALAYWEFAFNNPELYQVMNGIGGVPFCVSNDIPEANQVFITVWEALEEYAHATDTLLHDPEDAVKIVWALLHGLVALTMSEQIDGGRERGAQLVERGMRALVSGWAGERVTR
jgi:AcrR family transcriptional regulator